MLSMLSVVGVRRTRNVLSGSLFTWVYVSDEDDFYLVSSSEL